MAWSPELRDYYYEYLHRHGLQARERWVDCRTEGKSFEEFAAKLDQEQDRTGEAQGDDFAKGHASVRLALKHMAEGRGFNPLLERIAQQLEPKLLREGLSLGVEAYIGEFPTGAVNARATMTPKGALVLINTGLMSFLHQVFKIILLWMEIAVHDQGKIVKRTADQSLSRADAVQAIAEVLYAYLFMGSPLKARRFSALGGFKGELLYRLTTNCEQFVISHEYGHIIGGHFDNPTPPNATTTVGDVEIPVAWMQEFDADKIGVRLLQADLPRQIRGDPELMDLEYIVAGPLLFFQLDRLITKTALALRGIEGLVFVQDHPPAEFRFNVIRNYIESFAGKAAFASADIFVNVVDKLENDVVDAVKRLARV